MDPVVPCVTSRLVLKFPYHVEGRKPVATRHESSLQRCKCGSGQVAARDGHGTNHLVLVKQRGLKHVVADESHSTRRAIQP
jgi:hypothetical protein